MLLPSADQYSVIVAQNDLNTLSVLTDYTFLHDDVEKTTGRPGSNAVIFKAVKDGKTFAVRFFSRGDQASFKRYEEVARYLGGRDLPWKISFEVLDKELFFEGERYPVLLMEWIEAINLNQYINRIYNNPVKLAMLQESLVHLSRNLEQNGIGH